MASTIRVLVVDDSAVTRLLIRSILKHESAIEVVGAAADGRQAVEAVRRLRPTVVLLDVEMPVMNGLEALDAIRAINEDLPVIMVSSLTQRGAESTVEALFRGASDYLSKPVPRPGMVIMSPEEFAEELTNKVLLWGRSRLGIAQGTAQAKEVVREESLSAPPIRGRLARRGPPDKEKEAKPKSTLRRVRPLSTVVERPPRVASGKPPRVLAIGCSTGGPKALAAIIPMLPAGFPVPVVVVQHMPPMFTRMMAERLDQLSALNVREGQDGAVIRPGEVWIAPGGFHMALREDGENVRISLNEDPPENSCRPAVDVLFRSVASIYRGDVLSVILTGMGRDGLEGARRIGELGGINLVQDEATSVVWGMPGSVSKAGLADAVLPLSEITPQLVERVARVSRGAKPRRRLSTLVGG